MELFDFERAESHAREAIRCAREHRHGGPLTPAGEAHRLLADLVQRQSAGVLRAEQRAPNPAQPSFTGTKIRSP